MSVIPRFLTRLPLTDCSFDVDFNSAGDVGVTIPDGYYWCLGLHVPTKTTSASASVNVASGAEANFAIGDVVTVWDVSAGSALATDATVVSTSAGVVEIDTTVTTAIGDLLYHSNDLIGTLQARLQSADTSENSDSTSILFTSGTVTFSTSSPTYVITWGADGTTLRDRLGFSGSTATIDAGGSGRAEADTPVVGDFYPSKATVDERVPEERRRDAYETDNGSLRVFNVAQVKRNLVRVRFGGNWRTAATERTECLAFLNEAQQGYRVRYYPDVDVTDPWDESSTPWGYEEWILLGPTTSDPDRVIEGKTNLWEVTLEIQKWVG